MVCRTGINQASRPDKAPAPEEKLPPLAQPSADVVAFGQEGRVVELKFDDEPPKRIRRW